jgi:carboxyl-terminal processing protease
VLKNRNKLHQQYPEFEQFKAQYAVPKDIIDSIIAEAKKQKITPKDDEELQKTLPQLRRQLKALIARDLWDMNEYFSVFNEGDDVVKKALEEFK